MAIPMMLLWTLNMNKTAIKAFFERRKIMKQSQEKTNKSSSSVFSGKRAFMKKMALCLAIVTILAGPASKALAFAGITAPALTVEAQAAGTTAAQLYGIVNSGKSGLYIRAKASAFSDKITTVSSGSVLTILDGGKTSYGFYHVMVNDQIGWAFAAYLSIAEKATVSVSASSLDLHCSASDSAQVLVSVPQGSTVFILKNRRSWGGFYYVYFNGQFGWANCSGITFQASGDSTGGHIFFEWTGHGDMDYTTTAWATINGMQVPVGCQFLNWNADGSQKTTRASAGFTYANIGGKLVNVYAGYSAGYARMLQFMLYGDTDADPRKYTRIVANAVFTPDSSRYWVTQAGAGAHIRTAAKISLFVMKVTEDGFYAAECNYDSNNSTRIVYFSWQGFSDSSYSSVEYISVHN